MQAMAIQALLDSLTGGMGSILAKDLDSVQKALSALANAAKSANGLQDSTTDSLFDVSKDEAPLDGAVYKKTQTIFANDSRSRVKAVFRVQFIFSMGLSAPLSLLPISYPIGSFSMMIPAGFLYLLVNDSDGIIYQMPFVPKFEGGVELDPALLTGEVVGAIAAGGPVGAIFGPLNKVLNPFQLHVEAKGESTIENTFIWIRLTGISAYRALGGLLKLFNLSTGSPFRIGLQSCEGNGTVNLPVGTQLSSS
jgi:hypothetical protein